MTDPVVIGTVGASQDLEAVTANAPDTTDTEGLTPSQKREMRLIGAEIRQRTKHSGCGGSLTELTVDERYERIRRPLLVSDGKGGSEQLPDIVTDRFDSFASDAKLYRCSKCRGMISSKVGLSLPEAPGPNRRQRRAMKAAVAAA